MPPYPGRALVLPAGRAGAAGSSLWGLRGLQALTPLGFGFSFFCGEDPQAALTVDFPHPLNFPQALELFTCPGQTHAVCKYQRRSGNGEGDRRGPPENQLPLAAGTEGSREGPREFQQGQEPLIGLRSGG